MRWSGFLRKDFVGSPLKDWQPATQQAPDDWTRVFPLRLVNAKEDANIVLSWVTPPENSGGSQPSGSEQDWIHLEKDEGGVIKRRKTSFITLNISHHCSEDEMRATTLHELGHALGLKGHRDSFKDVMFPEAGSGDGISGTTRSRTPFQAWTLWSGVDPAGYHETHA
jgi:predicted Zn-dependent protease